MFNWFRKNTKQTSVLADWYIEGLYDFQQIVNPDSIQYANADEGRVVYFSELIVSGKNFLGANAAGEPKIVEEAGEWQLKGTRKSENKILVCVISVAMQSDIEWAKTFFSSIRSR